jgi:pimeloyl-ACP methyl ester carboxylesterase
LLFCSAFAGAQTVTSPVQDELPRHGVIGLVVAAMDKEMINSYAGMPSPYMHQIGDISLAKQWKQIDTPVLVIYSTSDPATSADESRYLVDIINNSHPGRANYVEIPGMGHDFGRYSTHAEFLECRKDSKPHPFDDEVITATFEWLKQQLSS